MASCMLCSSWVADGQPTCPRCGGAVEGPAHGPPGHEGSPWDDVTHVDRPPQPTWAPEGPFGAPPPGVDPRWSPPGAGPAPAPPAAPGAWPPPAAYGPGWSAGPYAAPGGVGGAWSPAPTFRPAPPTDGMAVAAFVTSLVALLTATFCGVTILAAPVGAVVGHLALRRIATSGAQGRGLALAGIILGWLGTAVVLVGAAVVVGLLVAS